jgi:hypothetical protein
MSTTPNLKGIVPLRIEKILPLAFDARNRPLNQK